MADMTKGLKDIWMKSMETISDTANKIAVNTRQKVNEMNIVNRRAEIMKDLGKKAYAMWQQGGQFPAEMDALMRELYQLDTALNEIRAGKEKSAPEQEEAPKTEDADEAAEEVEDEVCEETEADDDVIEDDVIEAEDEAEEVPAPVMTVEADEAASAPETTENEVPTIHVEE